MTFDMIQYACLVITGTSPVIQLTNSAAGMSSTMKLNLLNGYTNRARIFMNPAFGR